MSEVTKYFEQAISRWLDKEKANDELFADQVKASGKTVEGCCNYIIQRVRESKQCGYSDDEIYGMARHFFDEDSEKDPGKQDVQRIVVSGHIELSESEKADANGYFRKENCLILSARDGDGNRLETVEVNTKTWKIIQSRGLMNKPSRRHGDIIRIVNENMNLLKAI